MKSVFLILIFLQLCFNYYCIPVHNTIPPNVNCTSTTLCDDNNTVCCIVCKPGSVIVDEWFQKTINFQNALSRKQSLCYSQFPGSHNAAIGMSQGYGVEDYLFTDYVQLIDKNWFVRTSDQWFSLADLLNMGVRLIELDTHWVLGELRLAHCGGVSGGKVFDAVNDFLKLVDWIEKEFKLPVLHWDTNTIGCDPSASSIPAHKQRSLESGFIEITNWINLPENKNEFVLFFFDDQMDLERWGKVGELVGLIEKYFGNLVYTPVDYVKNGGFLSSVDHMVSLGKRVLFMSGANYGGLMNSTIFYKYGPQLCNWNEPDLTQINTENCTVKVGNEWIPINNGTLFRPETSQLWYGPVNGGDTHYINSTNLPPLLKCGINFPSPDLITPQRMGGYIWSYSDNEPGNFNCSIITQPDGRWKGTTCSNNFFGACGSKSDPIGRRSWTISEKSSTFDAVVCPNNYSFTIPINAVENESIRKEMSKRGASSVWISTN
eukprot:TRINITY_DN4406_c0_g1_i1.p1 TRINITY_DN4406_c0_g1~~TRINITY_DN4406_c0_g1_i1.p1  ORF type:complete len:489 (-),score=87.88 TRINITY_DN4406_c0_g1_i1:22-1488(-)